MATRVQVSKMDEEHLQVIRRSVSSFLADCARRFDGAGRLLDVAPQDHEGAVAWFRQAEIATLDIDPQSGATYVADLCQCNEELLPPGIFDRIVCTEVLEHVLDPFAAVREIYRLLKPGGYAFFTTPFNFRIHGPLPDCWRFTEHGLRILFKEFTIVSLDQVDTDARALMPVHYRIIARKEEGSAKASGARFVPEISVLITCYNEERSIDEFHARLSKAMSGLGRSYEIVFVNDGSADQTFGKLVGIFERDTNVSAILDMVRNSGQQAAITAAICEAHGRAILLMDSDLQLAPEEIPLLVAEYDKGFDVVSGARVNRRDSWLRIIPSKLANVIMRKATQSQFQDFGCTFKIYDARLVRAFGYGPHRLFSNVDLIASAGKRREVPVTHYPRRYGRSGWTFRKLMKYNTDNLVTSSERLFQILATLCLFFAALFSARVLFGYVSPVRILGTISTGLLLNSVVISLLIIVGVLCVVGEFAIRSFLLARNLPLYVVREVRRRHGAE